MSSMFPFHAKSESESDLSQMRLDAERKNAEEFPAQHPSFQASISASDFASSLGARVDQLRAELASLKRENKEQAERIRVLEIQNAALIAARDAMRGERDAGRHERQNVMQQKDEALRRQTEAECERDTARAEAVRVREEFGRYKAFFDHMQNGPGRR